MSAYAADSVASQSDNSSKCCRRCREVVIQRIILFTPDSSLDGVHLPEVSTRVVLVLLVINDNKCENIVSMT